MGKKKSLVSGYRLHKNRILFSGGKIIRTIKFPLTPVVNSEENTKFLKEFSNSVIADDLRVRGDLNLNDYLKYSAKDNPPYTLFDFWVDSLKAGVIWGSKSANLLDFVWQFYPTPSPNPLDILWNQASEKITKYFDKNSFKSVLLDDPIRSSSTKKSFENRLISYLKDEFKEKIDRTYKITSSGAREIVASIVNSFFDKEGKRQLDGPQQTEYWKREFNLDKRLIENAKPAGEFQAVTFLIIPELISNFHSSNESLDELIDKREKWLKQKNITEKDLDDWMKKLLGLTDKKFNGFSNYFGKTLRALQGKRVEELFSALNKILPSLEKDKEKVISALNFLAEKAGQLQFPALSQVSSWADYRSVFGGKLQSWFKNYIKRKNELDYQLEQLKKSLQETKEYFNKERFDDNATNQVAEIKLLINRLENFLFNVNQSIKSEKNYDVFDLLLSALKRRLNFFYQAYIQKEDEDEKKVTDFAPLKGLYKKIYKPVSFFGDATRKRNEKIVNKTILILEDGIDLLYTLLSGLKKDFAPNIVFDEVKKEREGEEGVYRKSLQFFWNKWKDRIINSIEFKTKYEDFLKAVVNGSDWEKISKKENKDRYVFYKSPYAKGTLSQVDISNGNYLENFQKNMLGLADYLLQFKKDQLLRNKDLLLDWIELAKNVFSQLIRFNKNDNFNLTILNLDNFERAKNYIELFKIKSAPAGEFNFIFQSLILSEIRGAATLYSRKEYKAQYSIQVMKSDEKFRLFYQPLDSRINLNSLGEKILMRPHRYLIALSDISSKEKRREANLLLLGKNNVQAKFVPEEIIGNLFRLSSSPYQLQFLDKYLYRPGGWEDVGIILEEWNFVIEKRYWIDWDLDKKIPVFTPKEEDKRNKVYVAIPFDLKPRSAVGPKLKKIATDNDKDRVNYPILGVDVGEYGLAFCLTSFSNKKIEILKAGFIEDKNIANIKDKFSEIQQRAKEGAFDEEDTTIARVRENAIGALRNKVHMVLTEGNGASSVYEASISNFETGSGRTTKVYNSVKRADTDFESDADKQIHSHVWGDKTKYVGRSLSAYASSYTCSNCLKSLYDVRKEDLSGLTVSKREGNIITIANSRWKVSGYSLNKSYNKGFTFKSRDEDLKLFRKLVRDFARPPVNKDSEVLNKFCGYLLEGNRINELRKKRGNSCIFVCPFCRYSTDADIQAAFMMAIRGYLRFAGIVSSIDENKKDNKEDKTPGKSFLRETVNFLNRTNNRDEIAEYLKREFVNSFQ